MPWQVPITVDGLEYPVTFNTEGEPTQQDYDEAVQQILSQKAQAAPEPEPEPPAVTAVRLHGTHFLDAVTWAMIQPRRSSLV